MSGGIHSRFAVAIGALGLAAISLAMYLSYDPASQIALAGAGRGAVSTARMAHINRQFGKLALGFEPNVGQTDRRAKFIARSPAFSVFLTSSGALLAAQLLTPRPLRGPVKPGAPPTAARVPATTVPVETAALGLRLEGANPRAVLEGVDRLPGTSNYFIGNDRSAWHTGIANYAGVRYRSIYPGIDLVFHGRGRELEFDLVLAPGADPDSIRFAIDGADRIVRDADGGLAMRVGHANFVLHKPAVYQEAGGTRKSIGASYRQLDRSRVGIELAAYDRSQPLVIDPTVGFSTYLGGAGGKGGGETYAFDIKVDAAGNVYLAGSTGSPNFPTTAGAKQTAIGGPHHNAFISKLNGGADLLQYSTYLGGSADDAAFGLAVDGSGDAFITGFTSSPDFPHTTGAFQTTKSGAEDGFVSELNPAGSALVYSTFIGGATGASAVIAPMSYGSSIALLPGCSSSCNAYITGTTTTTDFAPTAGFAQPSNGGTVDPFDAIVVEVNATGTGVNYATFLGGQGGESGNGIAVDATGAAYVTGYVDNATGTMTFPIVPANTAAQHVFGGASDAFITKVAAGGTSFVYSTFLGGSGADFGTGIAVDTSGVAFLTGLTYSLDLPVTGSAFEKSFHGKEGDALVASVGTAGTNFGYVTYLHNAFRDPHIAIDSSDDAWISAAAQTSDFPTVNTLQPFQGANGSLDASTDGGMTFAPSGYAAGNGSVDSLGVDNQTVPDTVYAGTEHGLWVSTDDGATFAASGLGAANADVLSLALDFHTAPSTVYAVADTGLFASTDQGATFATVQSPLASIGSSSPGSGLGGPVVVDDTTFPSTLYVGADSGGFYSFLQSTDGGATFVATGIPADSYVFDLIDDPNSGTLYIATNKGVYASTDNAVTFGPTAVNWPAVFTLAVDSSVSPSTLFAGSYTNDGIFESTDGFATLSFPPGQSGFAAVFDLKVDNSTVPSTIDAAEGFEGDRGFFVQSTDGGATFGNFANNISGVPPVTRLGLAPPILAGIRSGRVTHRAAAAVTPPSVFAASRLEVDATVSELSPDGSTLTFSSFLGGSNFDAGTGVAVDPAGRAVYVAGATFSSDFSPTPSSVVVQKNLAGNEDAFATQIVFASTPTGNVTAPAPIVGSGSLGQAGVAAGSFMVKNNFVTPWSITSVTVNVSTPAVWSVLNLAASPFNSQNVNGSPAASTVFTFGTPILLEPGETETFTLTGTISNTVAAATRPGSGVMIGSLWGGGGSDWPGPLWPLAGGFGLVMAMALLAAPRRRVVLVAVSCLWLVFALNQTGCDPCPTCKESATPTPTIPTITRTATRTPSPTPTPGVGSVQTLEGIQASDSATVVFGGLPVDLSTITQL
jgi:hypothetical protein